VIATQGDGRWIEYAGGYTDMLAQRGPARAASTPPIVRPRMTAPVPRAPARKMTFKDKHALDTLPSRIAALEADVARLSEVLANADLYAREPARFADATQALDAAQGALAAAEERWLALEMLREELEGA
jgi:ABC transport system ATP-binding/permease protein